MAQAMPPWHDPFGAVTQLFFFVVCCDTDTDTDIAVCHYFATKIGKIEGTTQHYLHYDTVVVLCAA